MIQAFEYLTNLVVRCPLPNPLPRERESGCLKSEGVGLGIRW